MVYGENFITLLMELTMDCNTYMYILIYLIKLGFGIVGVMYEQLKHAKNLIRYTNMYM